MSYYPKSDSHLRDKVKVLDLSTFATKKELDYATSVGTSDLASKKDSIALKAGIEKLDIYKLVNVPTSFNNLKAKIDDLHIDKLKIVPIDSKKLSGIVDDDVVKNHNLIQSK